LCTSLRITLQNKFLDFQNVEVSASHDFFKRASVWDVSSWLLKLIHSLLPTNQSYQTLPFKLSPCYFRIPDSLHPLFFRVGGVEQVSRILGDGVNVVERVEKTKNPTKWQGDRVQRKLGFHRGNEQMTGQKMKIVSTPAPSLFP
jgi:hypothetical protein